MPVIEDHMLPPVTLEMRTSFEEDARYIFAAQRWVRDPDGSDRRSTGVDMPFVLYGRKLCERAALTAYLTELMNAQAAKMLADGWIPR